MVALGCKFLRICHLNNCATGVATQDEKLRQDHFHGLPEMVMNYFKFIAQETREIMASLGVSQLTDLIGRTDLLVQLDGLTEKQRKIDLSGITYKPQPKPDLGVYCQATNEPYDKAELNEALIAHYLESITEKSGLSSNFPIKNTDRSVGARLSGEIAKQHGNQGMASDPITVNFTGTAGQSFGVWNAGGLNLNLTGDANDYVGKGMTGGRIVIRPEPGSAFKSNEAVIAGNTCLYGASGGELYAAGLAGERFAVRNSGANAVIEGIGDNGCEYMTGGIVTILGNTGVNFGAGMTGGFAYVHDQDGQLTCKLNNELVEQHAVTDYPMHVEHLRGIIIEHLTQTGSQHAQELLNQFDTVVKQFFIIKPKSADINALLGHRSLSSAELRVQAQ